MTGNPHTARRATAAALGALMATGLFATVAHPAHAYALEGQTWVNKRATFDYVIPGANSAAYTAALFRGFEYWNQTSAFKWVVTRKSANPCAQSGANGAGFAATDCGQAFGSGVLGITTYSFTSANRFIHVGTVFNSHVTFSVYDGPLRSGSIDFRRVALHEMGHALGMDHENNPNIPAIMAPDVGNVFKPTADDIRGVRAMYGPPS
jgi:hypothetical protein